MIWHKKLGILLLFALCICMSGCGRNEKKSVTISMIHAWGGTEEDHAAMRDIYEEFQKENPDIILQTIPMPTGKDLCRKVEDLIMVGDVPDIINFSGIGKNQTYEFIIENDLALDLSSYLEKDLEFAERVSDVNKEYWMEKDQGLYSIADVLTLSGGYWYNQEILDAAGVNEIPKKWMEFLEMCEKIKGWAEETGNGVEPHHISAEGYIYFMNHLLAEKMIGANGEVSDRELYNRAMIVLKKIYQYAASKDEEYTYLDEISMFNQGKLGIFVNGVWGAKMIHSTVDAKYALLPTMTGQALACESVDLGYVLSNSGNMEKQEAAVRFLKYMLSESVQKRILRETEQIPANQNVSLEEFAAEKERLYRAALQVENAEYKIEAPSNIWSENQNAFLKENIIKVLNGEMSEEEFGKTLESVKD